MNFEEKKISGVDIYNGKVIHVVKDNVVCPNGNESIREIVKHNGGAALYALEHFGAIDGQPEGIQGQSYAIPTDGNTFEELKEAVGHFTDYVVMHPQNIFIISVTWLVLR